MNKLFYGDNLEVLREHIPTESVDLIYLDPPFNSNARYNLLFTTPEGDASAAQSSAFHDTWRWGPDAALSYDEVMASGSSAAEILRALRTFLRESDMMSYLSMMTVRLIEMYRSLSPTGSLYLHCDPTASHYLKIILDGIFGGPNFRSEIVWKRSSAHSDAKQGRKQHGRIHDVLLFYTKGQDWKWNQLYTPYDQEYVDTFYRYVEPGSGRRYRKDNITAAKPGGNTRYRWKVKRSPGGEWQADLDDEWQNPKKDVEYNSVLPYGKRIWAYNEQRMRELASEGRLVYSSSGMPNYKRYLDEMPGVAIQDIWTDIPPISGQAKERLGYPTQKPLALLERIIEASSNPGDVVLDPFCGCGTTVHAAQALERNWVGIDVTHYAIELIEGRLRGFDDLEISVEGRPRDLEAAHNLAQRDKFQFQWWANWLVGVQNYHEHKKGPDRGIDGTIYFKNGPMGTGRILVSVKGGERISVRDVRDLRGTVEREAAELGLLVVLHQPTRDMVREAAASGSIRTAHGRLPKLQIATIEDLLVGKYPNLPPRYEFPREGKRPVLRDANDRQLSLPLSIGGGNGFVKEYPSPDVLFGTEEERAAG